MAEVREEMSKPEYAMNIIDAIRTLRKERNIGLAEAKSIAIATFVRLGIHVPDSIMRMR